jgi:hypothetical protein
MNAPASQPDKSDKTAGQMDVPGGLEIPRPSFSDVIRPLTEKLSAEGVVPFPDRRSAYEGRYSSEVRQVIEDHFAQFDISLLKIDMRDAVWLLSDPWGNMLRRPILGAMLLDSIKAVAAETPEQQSIKDEISKRFREAQFKSFQLEQEVSRPVREQYTGGASIERPQITSFFVNRGAVVEQPRRYSDVDFIDRILTRAHVCLAETRQLRVEFTRMYYAGELPDWQQWFTDPGHGFTLANLPHQLRSVCGEYTGPFLRQPLRFLHVEDDYGCFWSDLFQRDRNFVSISRYTEISQDESLELQVSSVKRVREILPILEQKQAFPQVCLVDLELPDGCGADLVKEIYAGSVPPPLIYLYSSNLEGFREQVDELIGSGEVIAAYDKMHFDLATFIGSVNQRLDEQNVGKVE